MAEAPFATQHTAFATTPSADDARRSLSGKWRTTQGILGHLVHFTGHTSICELSVRGRPFLAAQRARLGAAHSVRRSVHQGVHDDMRLFAANASLFADAEDAVEQRLMAEEVEPAWL